jgi:hypothetical protein
MIDNAVLDIAVGLVLMYLVLSLLATMINEFIATLCALRARTLQAALAGIIDDQRLWNDFYSHGLIATVSGKTASDHASYIFGTTFANALLGALDPGNPLPGYDDVVRDVQALPDTNVRDMLLAQIVAANGSLERLRQNIAAYFDAAMNRVSAVYKKYLQWISLAVGLSIAVAVNADSIAVGQSLWQDASVRAQMVASANVLVAGNPQQTAGQPVQTSDVVKAIESAENELRPLPIGWTGRLPADALAWLIKVFGLVLTALALSLGAPFWFDLLSQFMTLRSSGERPAKAAPSP